MDPKSFAELTSGTEVVVNRYILSAERLAQLSAPASPTVILATVASAPSAELAPAERRSFSVAVNGGPGSVVFESWEILRARDDTKYPLTLESAGARDREAIANPDQFLREVCKYQWLPTHLDSVSVRDRFNNGQLSAAGMRALLDMRVGVSERLMAELVQATRGYSEARRRQQAADAGLKEVERYVAKVQPLVGNAPGSTEPTSDIDINTRGDGTEFAVCEFNARFRNAYDRKEPGTVFDVNIYGKDFLPNFEGWPARTRDELARNIRPNFDHEFTCYDIELEDGEHQLKAALVKLRRYMGERWKNFPRLLPSRFEAPCEHAASRHLELASQVARLYKLRDASAAVPAIDNNTDLDAFFANAAIQPAILMEALNAAYEYHLRRRVETARSTFNLGKFLDLTRPACIDSSYFKLRQRIATALYFANEAYVTAGAVIQTVGGKQVKSRGVVGNRLTKPSFHNVAYTAHELAASVVDQLADIHKEAGRHFRETGCGLDVGGSLLGASKYIHRLLNAAKHLYLLFAVAKVAGARQGYPERLFENSGDWEKFRKLGFGLEALKKRNFGADCTAPWVGRVLNEEEVKAYVDATEENLPGLLRKKFSQSLDEINSYLDQLRDPSFNRESLALSLARGKKFILRPYSSDGRIRKEFGIEPKNPDAFYGLFERFVAEVLADYGSYLDLSAVVLRCRFGRPPPFTLALTKLTDSGAEESIIGPTTDVAVVDHADEEDAPL